MAGIGITAITYRTNRGKLRNLYRTKVEGQLTKPTWVSNFSTDMSKEDKILNLWKSLKYGYMNVDSFIRNSLEDKLFSKVEIVSFTSNNNDIFVHDLYELNKDVKVYCLFRIQYHVRRLLQVGAKTGKEMVASGLDNFKGSHVPLLVKLNEVDGEEIFEFINPL